MTILRADLAQPKAQKILCRPSHTSRHEHNGAMILVLQQSAGIARGEIWPVPIFGQDQTEPVIRGP
jgi:hypothetical protein